MNLKVVVQRIEKMLTEPENFSIAVLECLEAEIKAAIPDHESVTAEADRIVGGERGADYGRPIDDFSKTAVLWGPILNIEVTPEQVALCMAQVKVSRQLNRHKRDNLVDLCGYAKCLEMVIDDRKQREAEGWQYNRITGRWHKPGQEEAM